MGNFKSRKPGKVDLSRPSFNLTGNPREWRSVLPEDLQVDDIVAGMGIVTYKGIITCREELHIEAGLPDNKEYFLPTETPVKAFVKKEN